ncbi:hypothetical protein [Novosphingobium sp. B 225]|uniref:hypothetical protein n=1 Tax=Novosphingobium sp. B 225 TaxID=1961849 RepID=UPI000B4B6CDD|nr:hypothetical protein [Novosphingobium sp. B 225]
MTASAPDPTPRQHGGNVARQLRVGITGHRLDRLGEGADARLQPALAALFGEFERTIGAGQLQLVCGLADGADTIAAECALERGWTLDSVLPFARGDYAQDFDDGAPRERYLALLEASSAVLELPGARDRPNGESIAYERAGRVLLAQCDVLVAVWDGGPVRGRGGAAQIVTEAVQLDVPVIQLDPAGTTPPVLLWDGLEELALGLDTVDSVARGSLDALPELIGSLVGQPDDAADRHLIERFLAPRRPHRLWALAYPLLLRVMGVRELRRTDLVTDGADEHAEQILRPLCSGDAELGGRLQQQLLARFARADAAARLYAQLFRHGYVSNFFLAAVAVLLSLLGLALPAGAKPLLITLEILIIGSILLRTGLGNRAGWHRAWLDNRALAERLRCLAISARLGELNLRGANVLRAGDRRQDWVAWYSRATGREIGLPTVLIDPPYLQGVRAVLLELVDGELAYLDREAHQMHALEHRLHRLGTWLFALTAGTCLALLAIKLSSGLWPAAKALAHFANTGATIISAALPAFGAAIYGIRMQGDFAGIAERSADLAAKLRFLKRAIGDGEPDFDNLSRCARGVTSLLTADVASWLHTTSARPLALPG